MSRCGGSSNGTPSSMSRSAWPTQATIERRQALGLGGGDLRVADAHLDGAERRVRADRPPDLRVLDDRARRDQQLEVVAKRAPVAERVGHAAARKGLREDLAARGVQQRVLALEKRRAGADGEQQRQHRAQAVADLRPRDRRRARRRGRAARTCCCAARRSRGPRRRGGSARCRCCAARGSRPTDACPSSRARRRARRRARTAAGGGRAGGRSRRAGPRRGRRRSRSPRRSARR